MLDFCLTEQSLLISPGDFFSAWLTDCPGAVMTLSKYISSERERDGWMEMESAAFLSYSICNVVQADKHYNKMSKVVWKSVLL